MVTTSRSLPRLPAPGLQPAQTTATGGRDCARLRRNLAQGAHPHRSLPQHAAGRPVPCGACPPAHRLPEPARSVPHPSQPGVRAASSAVRSRPTLPRVRSRLRDAGGAEATAPDSKSATAAWRVQPAPPPPPPPLAHPLGQAPSCLSLQAAVRRPRLHTPRTPTALTCPRSPVRLFSSSRFMSASRLGLPQACAPLKKRIAGTSVLRTSTHLRGAARAGRRHTRSVTFLRSCAVRKAAPFEAAALHPNAAAPPRLCRSASSQRN